MVGDVGVGDVSAGAASGGAEDGPEVVIGARVGDVGVGEESAGAANGGAEGGPEVVIGARVVLGAGSGGVRGEDMALGAGAGAEWSGVPTGCIVGSCGGSARKCANSATGDVVGVGVGLGGGGEWAGGGVRRGGGTYTSSSTPTPLSSSTLHRLLTAFLVHFADGGEGVSGDLCGEGLGTVGIGDGCSGQVDGRANMIGREEVRVVAPAQAA